MKIPSILRAGESLPATTSTITRGMSWSAMIAPAVCTKPT